MTNPFSEEQIKAMREAVAMYERLHQQSSWIALGPTERECEQLNARLTALHRALFPAAGAGGEAARDVLAERERQKAVEGWTPEHDDEHGDGSLAAAGACYALVDLVTKQSGVQPGSSKVPGPWPWEPGAWNPKDRRRNLVRAGALILAEIERLDRSAASERAKEPTDGR